MENASASVTIPHRARQPRRLTLRLMALLVVALAALGWLYWGPVRSYALTGASYSARVACSCRFVGGRPIGDCRKDLERGARWFTLSDDAEEKSVTARFPLIASQTATYREGWGCQLEPWK
ncbi:MAG: hypothetical protein RIS94_1067 [Pseudomonadota bacterium]|jgi:hypothetical protein